MSKSSPPKQTPEFVSDDLLSGSSQLRPKRLQDERGFIYSTLVQVQDGEVDDNEVTDNDARDHAVRLYDSGNYDEAIALATILAEDDPTDMDLHVLIGNCHLELGQNDQAREAFEQVVQMQPNDAHASYGIAYAFFNEGDYNAAIHYLQDAVQRDPRDAKSFWLLGGAFERVNRVDEAIKAYEEAVTIEPGDKDSYQDLAEVLMRAGRRDEAIAAYQQLAVLDPENAILAYMNIMKIHMGQNHLKEALETWLQAVKLSSGNESQLGELASHLIFHLEQNLGSQNELAPDDPDQLYYVGKLYMAINHPQLALPFLRKAHALDSDKREIEVALRNAETICLPNEEQTN